MVIKFTDEFRKKYKKVDVRIKKSFEQRLEIFTKNPIDAQLRNHPLRDKYQGQRSINITADWRAIYKSEKVTEEDEIIYFIALGTHEELYGSKKD